MINTLARLLNATPAPHYRWLMYILPDRVVEKAYTLQLAEYRRLFKLDESANLIVPNYK